MSTGEHNYTLLHNLERGHFSDGYKDGDQMVEGHSGTVVQSAEVEDLLSLAEFVFVLHNRDNRPDGQSAPSLSIGDVVLFEGCEAAFAVADVGFKVVPVPVNVETELSWKEMVK